MCTGIQHMTHVICVCMFIHVYWNSAGMGITTVLTLKCSTNRSQSPQNLPHFLSSMLYCLTPQHIFIHFCLCCVYYACVDDNR